jgi:hypothetical protein
MQLHFELQISNLVNTIKQPIGQKKIFSLNPKIEIQKFGNEDFEIQQFAFKPKINLSKSSYDILCYQMHPLNMTKHRCKHYLITIFF